MGAEDEVVARWLRAPREMDWEEGVGVGAEPEVVARWLRAPRETDWEEGVGNRVAGGVVAWWLSLRERAGKSELELVWSSQWTRGWLWRGRDFDCKCLTPNRYSVCYEHVF